MSENNVSSLLKKLTELKGDDQFKVTIPSRKAALSVTPLNLKQQKDIISSVADGVAGMISFTRILNNIVIDATGDSTLKTYDRAPVTVALRVNALGTDYKDDDKAINLADVVKKFEKAKHTLKDEDSVEHNGIKVNVRVPTLLDENLLIKKLEEEIKRNGENNTKNLGSIYVYEIAKFIKSIEFDGQVVEYADQKMKDKIDIIEGLPLILNKKVIAFIEQFRKEERENLTVDDVVVEINPGFFDTE